MVGDIDVKQECDIGSNKNGIKSCVNGKSLGTRTVSTDFEYHVQFPKVLNPDERDEKIERIWPFDQNNKGSGEICLKEKEDDLVIVLLGWAGSEHKYLSKYSDIYLERGCIVVRFIAPVRNLFLDTEQLPIFASKLLQVLIDYDLDKHPIFFHAFSNGGGFMYSYILRELALGDYPTINIRGTVFDSAPAPRDVATCFKALVSIYSPFRGLRWFMAALSICIIVLNVFWYHVRTAFNFCCWGDVLVEKGGIIRTMEAPSQNWLSRISQLTQHAFLFIYSDADDLISSSKVEHFANILMKGGNTVRFMKFIDSPHVQHLRKYPEEYIKSVTDFIRMKMIEDQQKSIGRD